MLLPPFFGDSLKLLGNSAQYSHLFHGWMSKANKMPTGLGVSSAKSHMVVFSFCKHSAVKKAGWAKREEKGVEKRDGASDQ